MAARLNAAGAVLFLHHIRGRQKSEFNYDFRFPRSLKQENQSQFGKCYLRILLRCVSFSEELRRLPAARL